MAKRAVVITTAKRGVFFCYTEEESEAIIARGTGVFTDARMCVYWSSATKGVLGLAARGPQSGSRVGDRVPSIALESITAVIECSPDATAVWESAPWA